ncbi:MAG: DUF1549 domain-containing protein, partial [Verrucomicrobiae bacterium]|nr:DUF1549 domain-containing protein [Verrucomicrobiae bacterium]
MNLSRSYLVMILVAFFGSQASNAAEMRLSFNHDVRPILSENCFQCHGPDAAAREADLRLDLAEEAYKDRDGSPAIVPGDPEESLLIWMIEAEDAEDQMPPPDSNRSLTEEQKQILRRWIEEGAEYDSHWAFIPPVKHLVPVEYANPVDGFIGARLEEEGLEFSNEADPKTWLRRVSFDLTGLPPTLEDYLDFEAKAKHDGEGAYSQKVDELLASPRYGERMAWQWLEASRYADTDGYQNDGPREMWRWRDWVIDAYNQNLPFDQFTIEQLAGDLLPDPTEEQLTATAFHRNTMTNNEGGTNDEQFRNEAIVDRVNTTMSVWMGVTMACAQCHNHKYDPLTQREYYQMFAYLNNSHESNIVVYPAEQLRQRVDVLEQI